jgi:hypothetical protein
MRTMILGLVLLASACGNSFGICDLKNPPKQDACAAGIVPDTSANVCKDSNGAVFICRNGLGYCVVCNGGSFANGCTMTNNGTDSYCIHDCSDC